MHLKHLTDIHSGRNAQRIKNDIERSSVGKERHILGRKYSRNDTLITVTARHLVADRYLTLLSEINANNLVYTGGKLVAVFT